MQYLKKYSQELSDNEIVQILLDKFNYRKANPRKRKCAKWGCKIILNPYNPSKYCAIHYKTDRRRKGLWIVKRKLHSITHNLNISKSITKWHRGIKNEKTSR